MVFEVKLLFVSLLYNYFDGAAFTAKRILNANFCVLFWAILETLTFQVNVTVIILSISLSVQLFRRHVLSQKMTQNDELLSSDSERKTDSQLEDYN